MDSSLFKKHITSGKGKISMIKEIRILTGFGLKESKDIADSILIDNRGTLMIQMVECRRGPKSEILANNASVFGGVCHKNPEFRCDHMFKCAKITDFITEFNI